MYLAENHHDVSNLNNNSNSKFELWPLSSNSFCNIFQGFINHNAKNSDWGGRGRRMGKNERKKLKKYLWKWLCIVCCSDELIISTKSIRNILAYQSKIWCHIHCWVFKYFWPFWSYFEVLRFIGVFFSVEYKCRFCRRAQIWCSFWLFGANDGAQMSGEPTNRG